VRFVATGQPNEWSGAIAKVVGSIVRSLLFTGLHCKDEHTSNIRTGDGITLDEVERIKICRAPTALLSTAEAGSLVQGPAVGYLRRLSWNSSFLRPKVARGLQLSDRPNLPPAGIVVSGAVRDPIDGEGWRRRHQDRAAHGEPLRRRAPPGKSTTFPIAMLNSNERAITLNLKHARV
jgi:hypothetical protein